MSGTLVTGASGFIGAPLLAKLAERDGEVHALTSREAPPGPAGVSWHRADLLAPGEADRLLAQVEPERLVHLAWYVEHGRFWDAPENVLWVEQSLALLRAFAAVGGRRVVMLGTSAEYDWTQAREALSEADSPLAPTTLYGACKDGLRRIASAYAGERGIELAWGRLFFLYGPRESPGRLVAAVIRSLLAGERIETTAGTQRRDFLHVEDVAGALLALLESSLLGAVNIGSGVPVPVGEIVDRLAEEIGRPDLVLRGARPERAGEPPLLLADVSRLREEAGFRPRWDLEHGLLDAVAWWRAQSP